MTKKFKELSQIDPSSAKTFIKQLLVMTLLTASLSLKHVLALELISFELTKRNRPVLELHSVDTD